MNISEQLLVELSRVNANYVANYVGNDIERFKELMQLILKGKSPLPERASWVASTITDTYPDMIHPYLKDIVKQLKNFEHSGTRRNLLRSLASIEIPEKFHGKLYDDCYNWLMSKDEPPAVKVHSMQILYNISENEPDLKRELRLIIEELVDHESAAIRVRSRDILKKL